MTYSYFVANKMQIDGLLENPDEIVLKCSYCKIHFDYPCYVLKVTLMGDNKVTGFPRKELALKIMRLSYADIHISIL